VSDHPDRTDHPDTDRDDVDIAARARATRVVVVGGGIAGLTAAWECARIGMPVVLVEAAGRLGGNIETATLDGIDVDLIAEAFSLRAQALGDLIDELGLRGAVEPAADESIAVAVPAAGGVEVVTLPDNRAGIPANTWAVPVRRLIGSAGVWRAYLDRLRPPLTIGRERSLGVLVRTRMGARMRERLVAPLTIGTWGVDPDEIDVDLAVPGLSAALTRVGSLAGAVDSLLPPATAGADATSPPRRATLRGGLSGLVDALAERLAALEADVRVDTRVTALSREAGGWTVHLEDTGEDDGGGTASTLAADVVVLAAGPRVAAALVAPLDIPLDLAPDLDRDAPDDTPASVTRQVVTLVMDAGTSNAGPASVYPVPGTMATASALDVAAAWPTVAAAAGPDRRVLRLTLDDADPIAVAAGEVARLWPGVGEVRASAVRAVELLPPASVLGHAERAARARAALARGKGMAAVGEWLAGGGIASVVADTVRELERVRGDALWRS